MRLGSLLWRLAAVIGIVASAATARAQQPPIRIGFGMAMTGPLASSGKVALLAFKIWESEINAKGGLLGRPVKLISYDDQSSPANVPAIYTKLLELDKVDLIISGYATPMIAAAIPIAMQRNMLLMGLFGLDPNARFQYDKYFGVAPIGSNPSLDNLRPFFAVADTITPKPKTVAVIAPDIDFGRSVVEGARALAKERGLQIVYDRGFPPSTSDFSTMIRQVQAANADLVVVGTQPGQTISVARAIAEVGLKAQMVGGSMTGLQTTDAERLLGAQLNGLVNFNYWLPVPALQSAATAEFFKTYQALAPASEIDPIGYYIAPWAYAEMQILQQAIEATKSLDNERLGEHMRKTTFPTLIGDVKFGANGEWATSRVFLTQFQGVAGNDVEQFKGVDKLRIVSPGAAKNGDLISPFQDARK